MSFMSLIFKNDASFLTGCVSMWLFFINLLKRQSMVVHLFFALTVSIRWRLLFPTLCWSINTTKSLIKNISTLNKLIGLIIFAEPKVSPSTFCRVFPFHLMFDRELNIVQAGRTVSRLLPRVTRPGCKITDVLDTVSILIWYSCKKI
jgi:hypothetical protein